MEELLFKLDNLAGTGGLTANKLSYSSDILSGDECDDDVEYLYRPGYPALDHDICGSGYESDQSFFSFGSANQEGLTDLEKERKISKDSSILTISESNYYDHPRGLPKPDSQNIKLPGIQTKTLTPRELYRRHSDNGCSGLQQLHSSELRVEPKSLQSSSGTSMSSRRPSLTKEFVKPKHLYPLTRKPKIRNGQVLLRDAKLECSLPENLVANVEDSTTSEEIDDKECTQMKSSRTSKKHGYRRALGLFPKSAVAPADNDPAQRINPPVRIHDAFRTEVSSLSSPDGSYNRRSSSSSDENQTFSRPPLSRSAFMFDENQHVGQYHELHHPPTVDIPPLSPSEPGFGINSQEFYEAQDNLGFIVDSEMCPPLGDTSTQATSLSLPGLIGSICMNTEIGTNIESINEEKGQIPSRQTRDTL
jgi:hypothetical protein